VQASKAPCDDLVALPHPPARAGRHGPRLGCEGFESGQGTIHLVSHDNPDSYDGSFRRLLQAEGVTQRALREQRER
jgi:hypothetical protein